MKKINLNQIQRNLSNLEMKKIMAGSDIINNNTISTCVCGYNNDNVITNSNSVDGCLCTCTK